MTKNTIKPAYRKIEERYVINSILHIDYTNSTGEEEVRISNYCSDWKYSDGRLRSYSRYYDGKLIEHSNKRRKLSSYLERIVNELPLHVRKVMGEAN